MERSNNCHCRSLCNILIIECKLTHSIDTHVIIARWILSHAISEYRCVSTIFFIFILTWRLWNELFFSRFINGGTNTIEEPRKFGAVHSYFSVWTTCGGERVERPNVRLRGTSRPRWVFRLKADVVSRFSYSYTFNISCYSTANHGIIQAARRNLCDNLAHIIRDYCSCHTN